jgi:hypothetical protein
MTISEADHTEIEALVARYGLTTDNADADAFMDLWVEPAEFGGYRSEAFGTMNTWQEMLDFETKHVGPGGMANGKRHQATNLLIEPVSETEAHVTHDMIVLEVVEAPRIIATGRYDRSVVVKTPAGWKLKERTLVVDPGFFTLMSTEGEVQK